MGDLTFGQVVGIVIGVCVGLFLLYIAATPSQRARFEAREAKSIKKQERIQRLEREYAEREPKPKPTPDQQAQFNAREEMKKDGERTVLLEELAKYEEQLKQAVGDEVASIKKHIEFIKNRPALSEPALSEPALSDREPYPHDHSAGPWLAQHTPTPIDYRTEGLKKIYRQNLDKLQGQLNDATDEEQQKLLKKQIAFQYKKAAQKGVDLTASVVSIKAPVQDQIHGHVLDHSRGPFI